MKYFDDDLEAQFNSHLLGISPKMLAKMPWLQRHNEDEAEDEEVEDNEENEEEETDSYKIIAKYRDRSPEKIDEANSRQEAEYLLAEYRMAFGEGWKIWIEGDDSERYWNIDEDDLRGNPRKNSPLNVSCPVCNQPAGQNCIRYTRSGAAVEVGTPHPGRRNAFRDRKIQEPQQSVEQTLTTIRDAIYGGSWEEFKQDLEDSLNIRPMTPNLYATIKQHLAIINSLKYRRNSLFTCE